MTVKAVFRVGNATRSHLEDITAGKLEVELSGAKFASGEWTISLYELDETLLRKKLKLANEAEAAAGSDDLLAVWEGSLAAGKGGHFFPAAGSFRRSSEVPEREVWVQVGFAGDPQQTTYNVYLRGFQEEMDIHELGVVVHPKGNEGAKDELRGALTVDATEHALAQRTQAVLDDVSARRSELQALWEAKMAKVAEITGYDMSKAEKTLLGKVTRERVRIVLEAAEVLGDQIEPETIFALWHKEGSSNLAGEVDCFSGYGSAEEARYVGRAYSYWIATGNDHFHAKSGATAKERKKNDNEPSLDPSEHRKVFSRAAKPLIDRGWIPADIEQRVHQRSLTASSSGADFEAQPTGKFDLYAILLMAAEFLRRQKDAGDRVDPPQAELSVVQARIAYVVGEGKPGGEKGLAGMWGSATEHRHRFVLLNEVLGLKERWVDLLERRPDHLDAEAWSGWVDEVKAYLDRLGSERARIEDEGKAKVTGKFVGKANRWRPDREWRWVDKAELERYEDADEEGPAGMLNASRQDDAKVKAAWKRWDAFRQSTQRAVRRFEHPRLKPRRLFRYADVIKDPERPSVEEFILWSELNGWYWSSWQTPRKGILKMMAMRELFAEVFRAAR